MYKGTQSAAAVNWLGDTPQEGHVPGGWATNGPLLPQVVLTPMLQVEA